MALASQIMGAGFSAGQALAIGGGGATGLTAAGSVIGDALHLSQSNNIVATTAASTGVQLPPGAPGDQVTVYNAGASTLTVYPQAGATINSGAASAGFSVATTKSATFRYVTGSAIIALLSA